MRKRFRLAAWLTTMTLLGAACSSGGGSASSTSSPTVKEGGTLRIGASSYIDSLNPFVGYLANSFLAWYYTYPLLLQYDANNNLVPNFAQKWAFSSDGLKLTMNTVPNAKWSDGQPLTADDVAWTFNTIIKYQAGPTALLASNVSHMKKAEASGPNTVIFTYATPVANALSLVGLIPILPQQIWGAYAKGDGKALKTYQNVPTSGQPLVSGGPFQLVRYQKDQVALFQRNPNWWGPKPHISGFGLEFFSNNDAMITALKTGQLDAIESVPFTAVKAVRAAGFQTTQTPGVFFYYLVFNSNPKKTQHRELLNPQVRQAFEYAIDRNRIIQTALLGYGAPGASIVPPGTGKWSDPSVKPLPFDAAKANQILDSLGYQKGSDGIRMADGAPMSYTVYIPNTQTDVLSPTFQIMQTDFQQIGVKLTPKVLDSDATFAAETGPNGKYLTNDLAMWDWIPYPDPDYILSVLQCDQWNANNDAGYCNHQYDALYQQQGTAIDPQKRLQIVYQMQKIAYNDRPYVVLDYPDVIDGYSKNWAGFYNEKGFGILINNGIQSLLSVHQT